MAEAYLSGDPYLAFAKQAGAVPAYATKQSHPNERELFKACALGVQYGMGEKSLAARIGRPVVEARRLLSMHHRTYAKFWAWSKAAVARAMLHGVLNTVFGWRVHAGPETTARSLMNFPMQANGAEILRLACCLTTEGGIKVCAPVHDAILIEAAADDIDKVVQETQALMKRAGEVVLDGFPLRSDVELVEYPDRYADPRGRKMWKTVSDILGELCPGQLQREAIPV
jgi:DNA polymerase I-like protein with 3'-5' exonuclease and polymerase domains